MTELKTIIKNVISKEIQQDENVVDDSFILNPVMMDNALKGDGEPTEISITYQLDVFFKNKGELLSKAKQLDVALAEYPNSGYTILWESTARLWRATIDIEKI